MAITEVGNTNFWKTVLPDENPAIVAFWATWCGACKRTMPVVEQFATDHHRTVSVYKVNVGDEPAIAYEYGVTAAPTLKVFRGGQVVKTIIGARTRDQLDAELAEFIAGPDSDGSA